MTLTVPTAGTSPGRITRPGRAARPGQRVVDQSGQALAQFGQVMQSVGVELERDRLDRQMQRASIDMARGFGELREQIADVSDPDDAAQIWMQGVDALRQSFAELRDDGRRRIDNGNAERFGLAFDQMLLQHETAVGHGLLTARAAQRAALEQELLNTATGLYASEADPGIQKIAIDQVTTHLGREITAGRLGGDDAEVIRTTWMDRADTERALVEVSDDDDEALAFDLDDADRVAVALTDDPDFARLAQAVSYQPDSPGAVADMQGRLEEFATLDPAGREEYLSRANEDRGRRIRANIPRPKYLRKAVADPDGLQDAINRTVAAYRGGQIDLATYAREADHLRQLMETYHG
ncbi:MAG: hypothetical protein AB3N12_01450 [Ruegeria sp.]